VKLENKVAIITGASSGIGQAGAIALAKEGADLLITYKNNKDGAIDTKKKINDLGRKCEILNASLENMDDVKMIINRTLEIYPGIDILVNNAGDCRSTDFLNETIENLSYLLDVDVKSVFLLSQLVAKEMIKRGGGSIINITSISGIWVNDLGIISYCTSKAAANMLTKGMAKALAKYNIKVNAILPGYMDTPLTWKASKIEREVLEKEVGDITPMKRFGQPEDIAGMIVFMSSDESNFMTGSLVVIDGGILL